VAGLGAGFAVTAGVGARRATTAWDRMREATLAAHAIYSVPLDADPALAARVAKLPEVEAIGSFTYVPVAPAPLQPGMDGGGFIALDPNFGVRIYRSLILEGRHADPRRADEVTINEAMAKKGIRVGQEVDLLAGFPPDTKPIGRATVVGVHRGEFDLGVNSANAVVLLNYPFLQQHRDELQLGPEPGALARLRGGDGGATRFQRSLRSIYGPDAFMTPGGSEDAVVQAVDVQKVAWTLLAAAAGLAVLVAAGQALSRVAGATTANAPALRALGMRRPQLAAVGAMVGLVVAFFAAIVAVAVGILASPLVPSGLAYRADPDRGIHLEPAVLAAGAAAVIAVLVAAGALAAWRAAGAAGRGSRSRVLVPGRGPVPVALGSQWALGPSGGVAAASARSALAAVAVGLAGVIAVVTFASSNDRLRASPAFYGWSFDGGFDDSGTADLSALRARLPRLAADRDVTGLAWGSIITILLEAQPVEAYELDQAKGLVVHPTLLEGRAPTGAGEIALATGTLRDLDKQVGDAVTVAGPKGPLRLVIVGRATYPEMGTNGDMAHMASLTRAGADRLRTEVANSFALVRVRPGADPDAVLERHQPAEGAELIEPFEPPKVHNLGQAGSVPWVLAGFLVLLGLAAVGHALVMSVRARRGEIAVLRTMGLVRRQVGFSVAAQATTTVIVGSLLGVPLGIALGRWAWSLVANGLGVIDDPTVPSIAVVAAVPVAIVAANLIAAGPAAAAARLHPAQILRSE
jgi:ABC-type lipoprotein release transport system permease subunit